MSTSVNVKMLFTCFNVTVVVVGHTQCGGIAGAYDVACSHGAHGSHGASVKGESETPINISIFLFYSLDIYCTIQVLTRSTLHLTLLFSPPRASPTTSKTERAFPPYQN